MYCDKCGEKRIADESYCHNCGNVFGSRVKDKKKDNKFLKWILWIIIAVVVIYASLVVGKMIGNNEDDSKRIDQLEVENTEIKDELAEQENKFEETISKIIESINSGKDGFVHQLEGISDKLKEDIIKLIDSFKKDSEEKNEKDKDKADEEEKEE